MIRFAPGLLVAALVASSACTSNNPFFTAPTDTSTPAVAVTETFDGQVTVNGAVTHSFIVSRAGTVTARLTAVDPDTATIGVSLGTWNAGTNVCQIILANDAAPGGTSVVGTASVAGNFCVRLYDVGRLTAPVLYTVDVTHF
jgi:ABC-type Fe3+-hydroxamate transport system substrate-binding protein